MSRERLADAFDNAAAALGQLAHELRGTEPEAARASVPPPVAAARPEGVPPPAPSGHLDTSRCPKHGEPFVASKNPDWPSYCPKSSDDPAWSNAKGYCRINSKNAGEWLALHGRAA